MQEHQINMVKRAVFAVVMVIAAVLLIYAQHEVRHGATYKINNLTVNALEEKNENKCTSANGIAEPLDLSRIIRITLGGNCTPAALLGTNSFGSFNWTAEENGMNSFFAELSPLFAEDDCTVLGCAAVLSDREFSFDENASLEMHLLGPAKNAEIFSQSSVEILSLCNKRAECRGTDGLNDTKAALEAQSIAWVDQTVLYCTELYDITLGILGICPAHGTDTAEIIDSAKRASEQCDYLIVYAEREEAEDDYYTLLAQGLIDSGCDLICFTGGGSPAEAVPYNNGMIVDSLGYLLDGGSYTPSATALFSLSLSVRSGVIEQAEGALIPIVFESDPWIPMAKE